MMITTAMRLAIREIPIDYLNRQDAKNAKKKLFICNSFVIFASWRFKNLGLLLSSRSGKE